MTDSPLDIVLRHIDMPAEMWSAADEELSQLRSELTDLKRHYTSVLRELAQATGYACEDDNALMSNFDPHEAVKQLTEQLEKARDLIERAVHAYEETEYADPVDQRAWLSANAPHESDGKEVK